MPKKYSVNSLIICDDIKSEAGTEKEMLIGVYRGNIIIHEPPPIALSALWFRISLNLKSKVSGKATFEIVNSKRKKIFAPPPQYVSMKKASKEVIFALKIMPFPITEVGKFSVRYGIGKDVRKIGEFDIKYKKQ